jgi:hypothetical protein
VILQYNRMLKYNIRIRILNKTSDNAVVIVTEFTLKFDFNSGAYIAAKM